MERQDIAIRFSELRQLASTVPTYLAEEVMIEEKPTLRTAVEDEFGLAGLDTEELILKFGERYQVDLTKFDFSGCISSEVPEYSCLYALVLLPFYAALFLLAWVANIVAALCFTPFSIAKAKLMLKAGIGKPLDVARGLIFPKIKPRAKSKILTTGDFVASAATGYFVKREQVRFILAK